MQIVVLGGLALELIPEIQLQVWQYIVPEAKVRHKIADIDLMDLFLYVFDGGPGTIQEAQCIRGRQIILVIIQVNR